MERTIHDETTFTIRISTKDLNKLLDKLNLNASEIKQIQKHLETKNKTNSTYKSEMLISNPNIDIKITMDTSTKSLPDNMNPRKKSEPEQDIPF